MRNSDCETSGSAKPKNQNRLAEGQEREVGDAEADLSRCTSGKWEALRLSDEEGTLSI